MANMREEAIVDLKVDDSEATTKWAENRERIKEINQELRKLKEAGETGSDGYKAIQTELRDLNSDQKTLLHNIDLGSASINEMQNALRYWTSEAKKAEQGSEEWIIATKKIDDIKPVLNEAQTELRGFGVEVEKQPGMWDSMKTGILSTFTGMGLFSLLQQATTAIFNFGKSAVEDFDKAAQSSAQLNASLESTGHGAGLQRDELDKLSEALAKKTRFDDDAINGSQALLLTFTDIKKGVYEQALPAILDMAEKMGGDSEESLKTTSIQVGKALNDPIHGMTALKKVGVSFTEDQKDVIKSLQDTGDMAGAQQVILAELTKEFGGSAEAAAQAGTGGLTVLFNRLGNVKESIGELIVTFIEGLYPIFAVIATAVESVVTSVQNLISGNANLGESTSWIARVFGTLWEILGTVWDVIVDVVEIGAQLFTQLAKVADGLFETSGGAGYLEKTLQALSVAFKIVGSVLIMAMTGLVALAECYNVLINKGKEVANFFGSEFKIDTEATFANMNKHAEENISGITKLWEKSGDDTQKVHDKTTENHKKNLGQQTDTVKKESEKQKKEAEKLAKDKEKAESDLQKKIEDMGIRAIADDSARKIAKANLDYKRDVAAINTSKADQANKNKAIEQLDKLHTAEILKIDAESLAKQKTAYDKAIKEKDTADKKAATETKKAKDQALTDTKKLLDDEFVAEMNKAKISLVATKTNTQEQFDIKARMLDMELAHKRKTLEAEAAAERQRITDSLADQETKAARLKAVEEKLSTDIQLTETNTQTAKTKLTEDGNKAREKKNEEFYTGLNLAMKGDFDGFMKFLTDKAKNEDKHLNERLVKTAENATKIGGVMLTAVDSLMKLNKKYTDDKIAKLDKEQKANENKLKADFDKGKITKEQLDSELLSLDKKYKAETYDLRKKEFEREKKMKVAQALIAGSMAVLNSLALGFPVGLIGAAVIAVKTAIDIKKIKGAKFEGRSGGYVKNAGVVQGSRHGSRYGEAGIAMYDRVTGEEVGEIEGGEALAVMSRDTVKHNGPIIDRLVDSSLNRNGAPITMASGGYVSLGETPFIPGQMLLFGGKKKKAKAQAAAAQAEADAAMAEADSMGSEGGGEGLSEENRAIIEKNSKTAEEQLKAAKDTAENTGAIAEILNTHSGLLERIANKDNGAGSILHAIDSLNYTMSKATFK